MARNARCTVCQHPDADEIDRLIVTRGAKQQVIAKRFGVSAPAIIRHRDGGHLPKALTAAQEQEDGERGSGLLAEVMAMHARTLAILAEAENTKNHGVALKAIREARQNLELAGRLQGEIAPPTVNLVLAPQFVVLQAKLLGAVEAYPEARARILDALQALEAPT